MLTIQSVELTARTPNDEIICIQSADLLELRAVSAYYCSGHTNVLVVTYRLARKLHICWLDVSG